MNDEHESLDWYQNILTGAEVTRVHGLSVVYLLEIHQLIVKPICSEIMNLNVNMEI